MNHFPQGTRVCFFTARNQLVNGTVVSISRAADGTVLLNIHSDHGHAITLPAAAVTKI
ncbi:hypothetical protein GYMLUDRAFT_241525 [Collybiopsis luxurians FD-317 M1]|uniref:KOW domain-containing protein n=1 Tax=Collybiopsis luxurians FD-317 M1 TaxID=944289 RepID=A0A0D0CL04_9AGAR|nr:hypothetical protein GYMLUDRAFT_241525 [Collybiopsis luxurians FD-317 M1]